MTKNRIYLLFIVLFSLVSCYADKGNYNYKETNDVEIKGISEQYDVNYRATTLKINPEVTSLKDKSAEFEYMWRTHPLGLVGIAPVWDTLATTKDLEYLVDKAVGKHRLLFTAKDKRNGIEYYFETSIQVSTIFTDGWYVLKDNGTITDLDMFKSKDGIVESYKNVLQTKINGKAVAFTPETRFGYIDNGKPTSHLRALFIQSENELNVALVSNLNIVRDYFSLFYQDISLVPKQKSVIAHSSGIAIIDEGGIYRKNVNYGRETVFGFPDALTDNYKLSKYAMSGSINSCLFFDELNSRILIDLPHFGGLGVVSDAYLPIVAPANNMNSNCLYLDTWSINDMIKTSGYGVFENKDTKVRAIYKIAFNPLYVNRNPISYVKNIPTNFNANTAGLYAVNRESEIMYFAKDNKLGLCNTNAENLTEEILITYEQGTEITYINHGYATGNAGAAHVYNKLIVATYKGGNYKIYLYEIAVGKPVVGSAIVLEGEGRPAQATYIHPDINFRNSSPR